MGQLNINLSIIQHPQIGSKYPVIVCYNYLYLSARRGVWRLRLSAQISRVRVSCYRGTFMRGDVMLRDAGVELCNQLCKSGKITGDECNLASCLVFSPRDWRDYDRWQLRLSAGGHRQTTNHL